MERPKEYLSFAKEHLRVLYVEDNEDARFLTTLLLEEFFKEVVSAQSGDEALQIFEPGKFDIVVSDINMPGMSGIEFLKKVRSIDPEIYAILISAHSDSHYIIDAIEVGVDGYLLKPLQIDKLEHIVERVAQKEYFRKEARRYQNYLKAYEDATNRSFLVSRTDPKGIITAANELFCKRSKYSLEELIGKPHSIVRHPDNPKSLYEQMWRRIREEKKPFRTLLRNRAKDGSSYYVDAIIYPILDEEGNIEEYLSIRMDISDIMSEKIQLEMELDYKKEGALIVMKLMQFDFLERLYHEEDLEAIIQESRRVLEERLKQRLEFERLYSLGEGVFACVVDRRKDRAFLQMMLAFVEEINDLVVRTKGLEYDIEIGMSISFERTKRLESARYGLKQIEQKGRLFYVSSCGMQRLEREAKRYFKTIELIKSAIAERRFSSYFQPIVDNRTANVVKYESLIRLIQEDRVLSPYHFLDVAKQSNYYFEMSRQIIEDAFAKAAQFGVAISVNLSVLDLRKPKMRHFILDLLRDYSDIAHLITFEILEDFDLPSTTMIRSFVEQAKAEGVKIAIDDFGSGYANFRRILEYEPDIVKVDGGLVRKIDEDPFSLSVFKGILTFAKEQKIEVVAEFVENERFYQLLKGLGVEYSQGYYFGKPEPIEVYLKGR